MMITTGKKPKKNQRARKAIAAALVFVFTAAALPGISLAGPDDIIAFNDSVLKDALLSLSGADANADSELTEGELAALTGRVDIIGLDILDITGMQFATGLSALDLSDNKIRDISCLAALVAAEPHSLTELDVSDNYLDLTAGGEDMAMINALTGAGCTVIYEPQKTIVVEGVTLDKTSLGMYVGDTAALNAGVLPEDAADKTVAWSSDNEAVASVAEGIVTAKSLGRATITATTGDGSFTATCSVLVSGDKLASSRYAIADGYVTSVGKSTVVDVFKSYFDNVYGDLRVFKANGEAYDYGIITAGMTVKLYVKGELKDEATVLISGDANGDGFISISDYTLTRLDILGLKPLEGYTRLAADMNGDGSITISDYTLTRLDILGLKAVKPLLPDLPVVSDPRIEKFLETAVAQIGKPYVYGSNGPDSFDCSGYVLYCLRAAGYRIGDHTANTLGTSPSFPWPDIDKNELQPGDLMFYFSDDPKKEIGHVGIYLGNGYHIHASSDYDHIVICRVNGWYDETLSHGRRVFR